MYLLFFNKMIRLRSPISDSETCGVAWYSLVVSVSDPMTARSWVRSLTTALSSNNLGQVVHTPQPVGAMP